MKFKNKKVTVIGLGKSGFAAAKFLYEQKAQVFVTEGSEKREALENAGYLKALGVQVETGGHTEAWIEGSVAVIRSPGVPRQSEPLRWAAKHGIPVLSEVELASQFCRGRIVAVTGSNGKTTTCNLIHRVMTDAGRDVVLCGNVGFSFLDALPNINRKTTVVLELSSFQLEDSPSLRPYVAAVLNLHENHLDRHETLENYALAKENIFKNQKKSDTLILNADDSWVKPMAERARGRVLFFSKSPMEEGVFLRDEEVVLKKQNRYFSLFRPDQCALKGQHNLENLMAAAATAFTLRVGVRSLRKTFGQFKTLEHRIEPLGEAAGIFFVNDSKSTTVESTRAALLSVSNPVVLVAGGRDKGANFSELEPTLEGRVRRVVLYGEARDKIASSWKKFKHVKTEKDFKEALAAACHEAKPGDTVLLSPMCTSFDQFSSFEERGEVFRHFVEAFRKNSDSRG